MEPFTVSIGEDVLADLRERLDRTRWPRPTAQNDDWERGTPATFLRRVAQYWRSGYDWRRAEREINRFPQVLAMVDGTTVHALHVRSPEPGAVPLLLTHGWPGSFVEFLHLIDPLVDPRRHGGSPADAFHVVIPSIPGYGFSGPPPEGGWNIKRIAAAWVELMRSLGYDRFVAQGGDFGSLISLQIGRDFPEHTIGVHSNMVVIPPPDDPSALRDLDDDARQRLEEMRRFDTDGSGYMKLLSTRPNAVGYAVDDSPVGLLAWILDRFGAWTDPAVALEEAIDLDRLLTNVMVYWVTATAGSSGHVYFEIAEHQKHEAARYEEGGFHNWHQEAEVTVPLGVAVYPHDCFRPVRRLAERTLGPVTRWAELDRGGHFAALEVPDLWLEDVRSFVRLLRGGGHAIQESSRRVS